MNRHDSQRRQFFFCFGPPKSGTTLLQRALNLHPQVSCPSEHQVVYLLEHFRQLFGNYNRTLEAIDRRTGGQGATLISKKTICEAYRRAVDLIVSDAAGGKPIMGVNDNNVLYNLAMVDALFDRPGFIAIFRNPIDQGLSAWHHNLRLAQEENDPRHSQLMTQYGGKEGWLRQVALYFNHEVAMWREFISGRDNVHAVRYEDLVTRRGDVLRGVFSFLGAQADDATIRPIADESDLARMRACSSNPAFFRCGAIDMGNGEITAELRREIVDMSADALAWLGYNVPSARAGKDLVEAVEA